MKRRQTDVAQRLLEQYLEHVESWHLRSPATDDMSVVVLEVMEYRRLMPRLAEGGPARAAGSRLLP
ncbi:MAG: hypothetical protein ACRDKS_04185 [Actinomycetota bacterium]